MILHEKGPRRVSPVLHPVVPDQPRLGPGLDQIRLQGPEPCGRHGLLDRRACDRRRGAADPVGRRRRDGRRRRRSGDLPHRHRRLRRGARALDRLQRRAAARLAAVGQSARRLRDGRGRRRRRARGATSMPRSAAPRSMPRSSATACRATPITSPRRPRTATARFRAMRNALKRAGLAADRYRLHQRARHLDAARRRDRARRGEAAVRRSCLQALDVLDQIGDRASAGRRRRVEAIFSILAMRDQIVPPTLNLENPSAWLRHRSGAA